MATYRGDGGWGRSCATYRVITPIRGDGRWLDPMLVGAWTMWTGRGCWYRSGVSGNAGLWFMPQFSNWASPGEGWWSGVGGGSMWFWTEL